jgi:hypothetical protein
MTPPLWSTSVDQIAATQALEARIAVLEEHMRRVLLILGAAGTMLSEVRRDEGQDR